MTRLGKAIHRYTIVDNHSAGSHQVLLGLGRDDWIANRLRGKVRSWLCVGRLMSDRCCLLMVLAIKLLVRDAHLGWFDIVKMTMHLVLFNLELWC